MPKPKKPTKKSTTKTPAKSPKAKRKTRRKAKPRCLVLAKWINKKQTNVRCADGWMVLGADGSWSAGLRPDKDKIHEFGDPPRDILNTIDDFLDSQAPENFSKASERKIMAWLKSWRFAVAKLPLAGSGDEDPNDEAWIETCVETFDII